MTLGTQIRSNTTIKKKPVVNYAEYRFYQGNHCQMYTLSLGLGSCQNQGPKTVQILAFLTCLLCLLVAPLHQSSCLKAASWIRDSCFHTCYNQLCWAQTKELCSFLLCKQTGYHSINSKPSTPHSFSFFLSLPIQFMYSRAAEWPPLVHQSLENNGYLSVL